MSSPPPSYYALLRSVLSADRLDVYRQPRDADSLDAVARYLWNEALSEALYPTLAALEVGLRNNLHDELSALYGPSWFTRPGLLRPSEAQRVTDVLATLGRQRKPLTAGRVVAELTFGFWTSLCDRAYERPLWQPLWRRRMVLPYLPRRHRTRHYVSAHLNGIRLLRNRVFHYEPVWHRRDLAQRHQDILAAIGWVSPVLAETAAPLDRFPAVYAPGSSAFRAGLEALCRRHGYAP